MSVRFMALALAVGATLSAQDFSKVIDFYRSADKAKPEEVRGSLFLDPTEKAFTFTSQRRVHKEPQVRFSIKQASVTKTVYERTAVPRYEAGILLMWPLLFTKEKKHFLTLEYKKPSGDGQYALFQLDKSNYRECLTAIESVFGLKVERTEDK